MPCKQPLYLQDHLLERGLLVSTVVSPGERIAETMVVRADAKGRVSDWANPVYEERYPPEIAPGEITANHQRIVGRAQDGEFG